jgi:hypothetical protein
MWTKKKIYTICMNQRVHDRLVKFAKKKDYKSFSDFLVSLGVEAMKEDKKPGVTRKAYDHTPVDK